MLSTSVSGNDSAAKIRQAHCFSTLGSCYQNMSKMSTFDNVHDVLYTIISIDSTLKIIPFIFISYMCILLLSKEL